MVHILLSFQRHLNESATQLLQVGIRYRSITFRILWGTDEIGIRDEESWFDAIKGSESLTSAGAEEDLRGRVFSFTYFTHILRRCEP